MRDYTVYFSYYSEEYGQFDDARYTVSAETPFEAREKAWPIFDADEETKYRSNIRQYAVTWEPDHLNVADYFNAEAAGIKQYLGYLNNVALPNDRIDQDKSSDMNKTQLQFYMGSLNELDHVAKDLCSHLGMQPPSLYEELHYADEICIKMGHGEQCEALWKMIDNAKKWDSTAMMHIRDMFRDNYLRLCGETVLLKDAYFKRDGIFPCYADTGERDYTYISRWTNKHKIRSPNWLETLNETSVIPNSGPRVYYEGQILLANPQYLNDEHRQPENMLWQLLESANEDENEKSGKLSVENPITGARMTCAQSAFHGALRPDISARLDLDALKDRFEEKQAAEAQSPAFDAEADNESEDELEM